MCKSFIWLSVSRRRVARASPSHPFFSLLDCNEPQDHNVHLNVLIHRL